MYKKFLAIFTVLAILALSLTGCGGGDTSNNSSEGGSSGLSLLSDEIEGTDIAQVTGQM